MKEKAENLTLEPTHTTIGFDYSEEERKAFEKMYEDTLKIIEEAEVVKGTVVGINSREVIINIGVKSDGIIPLSEFRDMPEIKVGDEVDVYIEEQENNKGQLVLSRKKAKLKKVWEQIEDSITNGTIMEALVKRRTKGGLIVDLEGIEAFLPGSQIDIKPVRDFDIFLDKAIDVIVIKINNLTDNVIVSHKAVIEKSLENQKVTILNTLEKGQILEGIVKNMTNFGVFVGLGGIDGLLHITDISWQRINHPEEVLQLGQKIKVVVTDFEEERKRISLGMKQLTPNPWETMPESIEVGSKLKGKIVNIADYGAFLEIAPGIEGLIHISEISWSQHVKKVEDVLKLGDETEAVVLSLDRANKKMSLGIKQLTPDPWLQEKLEEKYVAGKKVTGIIKNIAHFGALIELEPGIDGLLHISDISWIKKINHPSDVMKLGDNIEVVILEFDKENKRIALGLKQLEQNPWETYESVFEVGSIHEGTVTKKTDKGACILLPYNLEGFVPKRHLIKENGQEVAINENLKLEIIEFSKANKRIVLAHGTAKKSAKQQQSNASASGTQKEYIPRNLVTAEKSTLGEIEALASLKKQLEDDKKAQQAALLTKNKKNEQHVPDVQENPELLINEMNQPVDAANVVPPPLTINEENFIDENTEKVLKKTTNKGEENLANNISENIDDQKLKENDAINPNNTDDSEPKIDTPSSVDNQLKSEEDHAS